jgi:Uma2 family endonuclease
LRWSKEEFMRVHDRLTCRGLRVELIHGEIWDLGPMNTPHAVGLTRTRRYLDRTFIGLDVRVQAPLDVSGDSLPLPDFAVVPLVTDDYLSAHPTGVVASLVVEIADSSIDTDLTVKAEMYATGSVREYWVLDVENRVLHVLRDPGTVAANGTAYRSQQQYGPEDNVSPLAAPDRPVKVADLLP